MRREFEDALRQLRDVQASTNEQIKVVGTPFEKNGQLQVELWIDCSGFPRASGGLPLRHTERFTMYVPSGFPFGPPSIMSKHRRFAGFEHVQWGRSICLYQSSETEWDPSDGMYGFLTRVVHWLELGSRGEFEPTGAPLHPPAVYANSRVTAVSYADTPRLEGAPWIGFAHLRVVHEARVDIIGWSATVQEAYASGMLVACAVLLDRAMPFEYPATISGLFELLLDRGAPQKYSLLLRSACVSQPHTPMYIVVGSPMRGISGDRARAQHLAVWRISTEHADDLRTLVEDNRKDADSKDEQEALILKVVQWAHTADVEWVTVREARPEVTIRRDRGSAIEYFVGKTVSVWGCGALGSHVAVLLARAGVKKLILRDSASVSPGVLVRQSFEDQDIGRMKAVQLAAQITRIAPSVEVRPLMEDLRTHQFVGDDWSEGADVVIDATASLAVLERLEVLREHGSVVPVPIVSMAVDRRAERGFVTIAGRDHSGGPADVTRRGKLEACRLSHLKGYANAFWPTSRPPIFQPEPGCSASTFVGSAADLSVLSGAMLNAAARDLSELGPSITATGRFMTQPHIGTSPHSRLEWAPDLELAGRDGYTIRITASAVRDIAGWIERGVRVHGAHVETGGVLFGERNDACRVLWVDEVIGPPPDSRSRADGFECGSKGVAEANAEKTARTRGSVRYIGMWHTHPNSPALPSPTDLEGMWRLTTVAGNGPQTALLVIVGTVNGEMREIAAYVFARSDFAVKRD